MYKLVIDPSTNVVATVQYQVGNIIYSIPFDSANTDYQEYLKFLAEGGQPEPADQPE